MPGFDNISGDESIMYADNASFDGTERGGKLTANGQLWIGATSSPHVRKGSLTSTGGSVTITAGAGTINLEAGAAVPTTFTADTGSATPALNNLNVLGGTGIDTTGAGSTLTISIDSAVVGETITGDSGGALSPTAGNWNIIGQQASGIAVMDTIGSGSTLSIEDRTRVSAFVVDASATAGIRGTYQTITAALAAASAGSTIYVRPGTYTENITLKAGVDIVGLDGNGNSNVVAISGSIAATFSGRCSITNCQLISGNSDGLTVSGASATVVTLENCSLAQNANSGTHYSVVCSSASSEVYLFNCFGTTTTNGAWFNISNGQLTISACKFANNGGSTINNAISGGNTFIYNSAIGTDNTIGTGVAISAGTLNAYYTNFTGQIIASGTATTLLESCRVFTPNSIAVTAGGSGGTQAYNCILISNNASAISASQTIDACNCTINSTTTNAVTGAGTINYGGLVFQGSSSLMNTTTQVPRVMSNDAIKVTTPGAYPYTTVPQDGLILVDTSSARTITPLASPTTGQRHIIKDSVGSAATNNITVTPSGKNIDGAASSTINIAYGSITIVYNGTEWSIV